MADGICTQERRKSNLALRRRLTPHPDPLRERRKVYTAYICELLSKVGMDSVGNMSQILPI